MLLRLVKPLLLMLVLLLLHFPLRLTYSEVLRRLMSYVSSCIRNVVERTLLDV